MNLFRRFTKQQPEPSSGFIVSKGTEIPEGRARTISQQGKDILIAHIKGTYYATSATCTHEQEMIDPESIDRYEVTCPMHMAAFDVRDGSVVAGPTQMPIATYPVKVVGKDLEVEIRD